jgi:SulP family sulfate permease
MTWYLSLFDNKKGIVLYMDGVPILDAGGLAALNKFISKSEKSQTQIILTDLQFQPLKALARAGVKPIPGVLHFYPTLKDALDSDYILERDSF